MATRIWDWDQKNYSCRENYIRGKRHCRRRLQSSLPVIKSLWPDLWQLFQVHRTRRRLRFYHKQARRLAQKTWQRLGYPEIWSEVVGQKVVTGLIHGDLKQSNIILSVSGPVVIDWEEYWQRAPLLIDVFYYLYHLSLRYQPNLVVRTFFE